MKIKEMVTTEACPRTKRNSKHRMCTRTTVVQIQIQAPTTALRRAVDLQNRLSAPINDNRVVRVAAAVTRAYDLLFLCLLWQVLTKKSFRTRKTRALNLRSLFSSPLRNIWAKYACLATKWKSGSMHLFSNKLLSVALFVSVSV
jgi:hypothetical protein